MQWGASSFPFMRQYPSPANQRRVADLLKPCVGGAIATRRHHFGVSTGPPEQAGALIPFTTAGAAG
jgi:hypothetical protein